MTSAQTDVAFIDRYRHMIVADMRAAFNAVAGENATLPLYTMIRYHLGWANAQGMPVEASAGKLLRPSLVLLCAEALGGSPSAAVRAASVVEFVHNFTLIHDDIEDRSDLRHGRATVWKLWGVPLAVNAGDGLWALARAALHDLTDGGLEAERALLAMRLLDQACVALCEGQDSDMRFEGDVTVQEDDYLRMIRGKTGALMAASAAIGGVVARANEATIEGLKMFGLWLGEAFQIRDDELGVWGNVEQTGKATGDDIRERKLSFPIVHALANADAGGRQELARHYAGPIDDDDVYVVLDVLERAGSRAATFRRARWAAEQAVASLESLPINPERREELRSLAMYAATRPR